MNLMNLFWQIIMWCAIAFVAFIALLLLYGLIFGKRNKTGDTTIADRKDDLGLKALPPIKLLGRQEKPDIDTRWIYVAGILHHATKKDIGIYLGYVANDSSNSYNPKAMGVYYQDRLFGYIPEVELRGYRQWSKGDTFPCAIIIFEDHEDKLRGRVLVVRPCNTDYIERELEAQVEESIRIFGDTPFLLKTDVTYNMVAPESNTNANN